MLEALLYLTVFFSFSTFLLTFHPTFKDIIALRLFSAMMLYACTLAVSEPTMFVGYGSTNVITYTSSMGGDPGRSGELPLFQDGFGYLAVYQVVYAFVLMAKYVFSGGSGEMNEVSEHDERYA